MLRFSTASIILLLLISIGCAGSGKKTLSNNIVEVQSRYPEGLYVLRQGSGDSPVAAADAARLEIAKFFEANISGETKVHQWGQSESKHGRILSRQVTEIVNDIRVAASREIPGIEIVGSRKLPNGTYESWAALSKTIFAEHVESQIAGFDALVGELLGVRPDTDIRAAQSLAKSAAALLQREEKRGDLVLINRANGIPSGVKRYAAVMTSLDSVITRRLDVGIVIRGDAGTTVSEGLVSGVSAAGIRCNQYDSLSKAASGASDIVISVNCSLTERTSTTTIQSRQQLLHWADWILSFNALDPVTKEIVDSSVLSGKSSGIDAKQARARMDYAILNENMSAVTSWVYALIFGT